MSRFCESMELETIELYFSVCIARLRFMLVRLSKYGEDKYVRLFPFLNDSGTLSSASSYRPLFAISATYAITSCSVRDELLPDEIVCSNLSSSELRICLTVVSYVLLSASGRPMIDSKANLFVGSKPMYEAASSSEVNTI